ncbi:MAG: hypothetical protein ABJM86_02930 [Hyphomicrobiales bacterium]
MAILAAASVPFFTAAIGGAVDYSIYREARQATTQALDSASLAVAGGISRGEIEPHEVEARALEFFTLNMSSYGVEADGTGGTLDVSNFAVQVDPDTSSISTTVDLNVPTLFAGLYGLRHFNAPLDSTAAFSGAPGATENIEFSFVLDVTGSMGSRLPGETDTRLEALQESMLNSLNILLPAGLDGRPGLNDDRVRVGLVPYATSVNIGEDYHTKAVGLNSTSDRFARNECVTEREGVNAYSDVAPSEGNSNTNRRYETDGILLLETPSDRGGGDIQGFRTDPCPLTPLRPLTNNRDDLIADINSLIADGATGGHMGINWGFNLLSENWQDFWAEESKPANYGDTDVRKVLVIMTDGEFNAAFQDADIIRNGRNRTSFITAATQRRTQSRRAALEFCDLAKERDHNIQVYTIAFGTGNTANQMLEDCATEVPAGTEYVVGEGPFYYSASSNANLATAFQDIIARELQILLVN